MSAITGNDSQWMRGLSVNAKISLLIVIVSSLTLIGFTYHDYQLANKAMQSYLNDLGDRVGNRLALSLVSPAWEINRKAMRQVLRSEMQNQNISCLIYSDATDALQNIVYSRDGAWNLQEAEDCPDGTVIWKSRPLVEHGMAIGAIYVGLSDVFQRQAIITNVSNSFLRLLLLEGLLVATLYLSLQYFFISPVTALSRLAQKITQSEDFSLEAKETSRDEIGLLERNFNSLLDEVRNRETKLQSASLLLEEQVKARTRELAAKAKELEASNERLRQIDALKTSILSTVSHELRTPLTSVLGYAVMARKLFNKHFSPSADADQELQKRAGQINQNFLIIDEEGKRLTRLINDFLDLSKIESGKAIWNEQESDLLELMRAAVLTISGQLTQDSPVRLKTSLPEGRITAWIDPDRFNQILLNLLNNALKFTEQGSVELLARLSAENVLRICVSDTGMGIPKDELLSVFQKFHQALRQDNNRKPGTGLGLAICKKIAEHYNADIWVESELGRGSRFYLELPLDELAASPENK